MSNSSRSSGKPARLFVLPAVVALALVSCATPPEPETAPPPPPPSAPEAPAEQPPAPQSGKVTRMPLGTLFQLQQSDGALIYDVRPAFFHRLGHIPGSLNWPKSAFDSQLPSREAEIRAAAAAGKPVVLYCTDLACPDARNVASRLAARGHSVSVLEGGWDAWKTGELPTE